MKLDGWLIFRVVFTALVSAAVLVGAGAWLF